LQRNQRHDVYFILYLTSKLVATGVAQTAQAVRSKYHFPKRIKNFSTPISPNWLLKLRSLIFERKWGQGVGMVSYHSSYS